MRIDEKINDLLKNYIYILNQMHEMKKKIARFPSEQGTSLSKHIARIEDNLATNLSLPIIGGMDGSSCLMSEDPLGQAYQSVRTDCEAEVIAKNPDNLVIVDTIKPIIKLKIEGKVIIMQRGVVIVDNHNK